jgi:signal transduction histidine kinase
MRRWLALLAVACTTMVTFAFLVPLAMVVKEAAHSRALTDAERRAAALVPVLAVTGDGDRLEQALASTGARDRIAIHLPGAGVIGTTRAEGGRVAEAAAHSRASTGALDDGYVLLRPVVLGQGRSAVIEVYVPPEELTRGVDRSWTVLAGLAVVLVIGSVVVTDRLGARLVRSTGRLGTAAAALGGGDLSVRVEPAGPPEVVAAGRAFNAMADQVVALLAAERELAADLSHRLRTPLTALRLSLGHLGPDAEPSRQALDRLEHEVDAIIAATRASPGRTGDGTVSPPEPQAGGLRAAALGSCDAAEVLRERLAFWSALAEDQGRPWELIGAADPVRVPVPAGELTAVVDALLGNVFRHTREGTAFAVTLHQGADMVGVLVADAGPGIPDPEAALRRGTSGSGSTGLGLDIARRLAESSGGSLKIDTSTTLGGAAVQLWLRIGPRSTAGPRRGRGTRVRS